MIVESGFIVFLSLIVIFWRASMKTRLWLLGHPAFLELPFGIAAYLLHYGTFSGMMAAAVACILVFGFVEIMKRIIGYTDKAGFHAGFVEIKR